MNAQFASLSTQLATQVPDVTVRGKVFAAAVGLALSRRLALPSTELTDPINFFGLQLSSAVKDSIGCINESIVLDCKDAQEWTRNLWMIRYNAAHPGDWAFIDPASASFFDSYTKVDQYLSVEDRNLVTTYGRAVLDLSVWVNQALCLE